MLVDYLISSSNGSFDLTKLRLNFSGFFKFLSIMDENRSKYGFLLSHFYTFACLKPLFHKDHARIGQRGFSRVVHCNDPDNPESNHRNYRGNYVSTTKYTPLNFIPKSLFEQFRRVANFYFLLVACVSFSPLAPFAAVSIAFPLAVVIGATMAKEAVEDWRRLKQVYTFISSPISVLLNLLLQVHKALTLIS